jgi:hypothetical protein
MRIWLDDKRPMPEGYDTHVKTAERGAHRSKPPKEAHTELGCLIADIVCIL